VTDLSAEAKRELLARLLRERAEQRQQGATGPGHTRPGAEAGAPDLRPLVRDGSDLPLSFGQERVWFIEQLHPGSPVYNLLMRVGLSGRLDIAALRRAIEALVTRHESLRTTFPTVDGRPVQRVGVPGPWTLPVEDLRALPPDARDAEERRRSAAEGRAPFDLATGPLLRTTLFRLTDTEHILSIAVHHIVSDGWSLNLMLRELAALYTASVSGAPPAVPALPVQYADFASWQRQWLTGDLLDEQRRYWLQRLGGTLPVLDLPTDRPRPAVRAFDGVARTSMVDPRVLEGLRELSRRDGVTLFVTLLTAFKTLLLRYTGQHDVIVGAPVAGRVRREIESLVGFFVNTLVLRTDLGGDPTFREAMHRVRDTVIGAHAHPDLPFEKLVEELEPERDLTRNPLFQVLFNMLSFGFGDEIRAPGLGVRALPSLELLSTTDGLTLYGLEARDSLHLCVVYSPELFDVDTVQRLERHIHTLLAGIVADPDCRLSALPLLPAAERHRLLVEWNATDAALPLDETYTRQFESQVSRTADAVAAVSDEGSLTYRELDVRAGRLARHLVAAGVGRDRVVALLAERSLDLLTWILAVFKAGGAYLPLDPRHPAARHAAILSGSSAVLVLVADEHVAVLDAALAEMDALARPATLRAAEARALPDPGPGPAADGSVDDLAYVIYTSGSTGVPKGAMVEQVGMVNHLHAKIRDLGLTEADTVAQTASQCFDISVWQFLASLLVGGRVRIVSDDVAHDPVRLLDLVNREGISVLEVVPSVLAIAFPGDADVPVATPALPDLRWLIVTGEAAPPALCRRWLSTYPHTALMNGYGPTECSDDVTHHVITEPPPEDATQVPIGRPIANMRVYVVDRSLVPMPIGVPGELCVGGIGVGRGYLGDAARTAEVFVADPFTDRPNARLYRTGDLARWRADGTLEFLGRLDHQVKVRGFRIELGEIEASLARHPAVREVVVVAREDRRGDPRLVAYVASPDGPSPLELRAFVARWLPEYMVPETVVVLAALPLTANGKIDRRALPEPELPARPSASAGPRTPAEELVADVWAGLLGLERVEIHENFFELGGHSLLATQVASRLREIFEVDVPVRWIFEAPTVAGLAARVEAGRLSAPAEPVPPVRPADRRGPLPLSFAQQRLWFLDQLEPGGVSYNIPGAVRLRGPLDLDALARSLTEIVRRHESLRTVFPTAAGEPYQLVRPPHVVEVPLLDLTALRPEEREPQAKTLAVASGRRPFDLVRGPLFRAQVLRLDEEDHVLLVEMHHIASDGWSLGVLVRELGALYEAFLDGRPSPLAELPIQYADFAVWQRQVLEGELGARQRAYWMRQLAGSPPLLGLPIDRPRPATQTFVGALHVSAVPADIAGGVRALGRRRGATLFMTLLAAFEVLLHRYTGQTDILVGTPVANRSRIETEGLIGFLVNTLVLRTDLADAPTFTELVQRVQQVALDAYSNQDVPFEQLVEVLQPARSLSYSPLFQVLFAVQPATDIALRFPRLDVEPLQVHHGTAKTDLNVQVIEHADGLSLYWEYNSDLFDGTTIARMAGHFETLLAEVVAHPDRPVAALPLLSPSERQQVLVEWNATDTAPSTAHTVLDLIAAAVAHRGGRPAVVSGTTALTYDELARRANELAHRLRARGVGPNVLVGIAVERSAEMVIALLGVLKAGGAYVPLDPSYPAERLKFMVEDAGLELLVTHGDVALPEFRRPVTLIPVGSAGRADDTPPPVSGDDLAYVIYTSGSTGTPKGVEIPHRALLNLLEATARTPGLSDTDVLLAVTSLSFDIAALELFLPLTVGGCVVVADRDATRDARALLDLLHGSRATVMQATPATWRLLLAAGWRGGEGLKVLCGGEALPAELAGRLLATAGAVWNLYGPTETTIWSTVQRVAAAAGAPPIGRPIANTRVYVLDPVGQPVPVGVAGELHIGGHGLARGYRDRPELTRERFVDDTFDGRPGARRYRTGDLVRWRADGTLDYLGRIDHQVKVRGFRIELGEIESVLARHPAVREAVAVALEAGDGERRLVAYAAADAGAATSAQLRAFVARTLPDYMVPDSVVLLAALPLTPNGKVDRRALPDPVGVAPAEMVAPRTPVEVAIARVWAEVLGLEEVSVERNFFELGGHSLVATRMIGRLREAVGVELPLRAVFEAPTVMELAGRVEAARRSQGTVTAPPLRPIARPGPLPLSFAQERLWFFEQLEPGSAVYNVSLVLNLRGRLDVGALESGLSEIARRHETLRATFSSRDGVAIQRIAPPSSWAVPVADLREVVAERRQAEAERLATEEAARPFDLATGPLARARLLRLDDDRHLLVVTFHHIVADGWAVDVFMRELAALYEAHVTQRAPVLPALPVQYADFAAWQRQWLSDQTLAEQLAYWLRQLAGAPPALDLPLDRPRPLVQTFRGGGCVRRVDPAVREALQGLSRRENATLFMTLLAAFNVVLARQSGQDDVCVGVPVAGRVRPEVEDLIGLFVNTLVFRTRLDGAPSFRELLGRVRETALGAYAHQDIPFEKLVEELQPPRDLGRTPLFQVLFNMMNFGAAATVDLPGLHVEPASLSTRAWEVQSKFDLTLYARDDASGLTLTAVYNADLFVDERMSDVLDQFVQLLTAVAADPDVDVGAPSLLTPTAARVLPDPTAVLAARWTEAVTTRFRRHARRTPDHPAVVTSTRTWSYGELEALSNQLSRHLSDHGVGRGDLVAIYAHRSGGLAWALLGVLKAGAAFMCLDPAYPAARTLACLQAAPPRAFIHLDGAGPMPEAIGEHLARIGGLLTVTWPARVDAATSSWSACATEAPVLDIGAGDLAYVAFTSGSTGVPKAIVGTHGPLAHFFEWHRRTSALGEGDRFAALSGLAHDPLLRDVLGAFWVGAAVCMPDPTRLGTPGYLEHWLGEQRISVAHVTPNIATLLIEATDDGDAGRLPRLRHVFFGGDALTAGTVDRVRRLAPHATFVNFYGTTETPQAVACYQVPDAGPSPRWRVPIGRGIAAAQLLVVTAGGQLAGIGELGEIQARTPNLSIGYLNDPTATAERFVVNPFTQDPLDRVYRTGDLGRYRLDGTVEFWGRRDGQVKVRGFRVELGDVEAALRRHPGVTAAVARLRQEPGRDAHVVAWVVGGAQGLPPADELRRHVGGELPGYMVPSVFVPLERLPLTPNGKIDEAALPTPTPPAARRIAPRTATETALAKIWADVLGLDEIGVADDFFELGGHSLLAVTLFSRVETTFGVTLPLATLFQAPTVERQAELVDRHGLDVPWRAVVPIQPAGSHPPLFAVPGLGGIVVAFNELARLLGPDQPFYGLQPRGLDGTLPPFRTVEDTAEHYLAEMRALQPEGPYHLMGVCMGGMVAFEMAQRLRAAGQEVAFLALLDVRPPHPLLRWLPAGRSRFSGAVMRLLANRTASYTRMLMQRPPRHLARELVDKVRRLFTLVSTGDPLRGVRGEIYRQVVTAANAAAMARYVPRPYQGTLVLVLAADRKYARGKDRRLAWRDLAAGGIDVCVVPGADSGLTLVEPNVRTLAEQFRTRLEQVRKGAILPLVALTMDWIAVLLTTGFGAAGFLGGA
jgi:amino acid adenylation domain-containing protein